MNATAEVSRRGFLGYAVALAASSSLSPFLPGTNIQYAWDSTSLGWFKECPRKYFFHMIEGWRSKHEAVALAFGIHFHSAMELYAKAVANNASHDEALRHVIQWLMQNTWDYETKRAWRNSADLPADDRNSVRSRENLVRSVVWYLDQFKDDPAKTMLRSNGEPMVELSFRFELDFGPKALRDTGVPTFLGPENSRTGNVGIEQPYLLCGHLDRIVEFNGLPFVMDFKTTTTTPGSYYFDQYDPDNQMSLYSVAARIAFHAPVQGVIINAIQVAVGFSRSVRGFVYKTPDQLDEWMAETKWWLGQAEACAVAGVWPANDKSCHKFGGCAFRKVCSKSPSVRQKFLETDFVRSPWNPLEVR